MVPDAVLVPLKGCGLWAELVEVIGPLFLILLQFSSNDFRLDRLRFEYLHYDVNARNGAYCLVRPHASRNKI